MQNLTIKVDFDQFPIRHTCDGDGISPRISVSGSDAPYLAIIMDDPDASHGTFTHWLAWNIPSTNEIPEGVPPESSISKPISAIQGMNDYKKAGYGGPCPSRGKSHRYFIRVWSTKERLNLKPGAERVELENELAATATGYGEAMATYIREELPRETPEIRSHT